QTGLPGWKGQALRTIDPSSGETGYRPSWKLPCPVSYCFAHQSYCFTPAPLASACLHLFLRVLNQKEKQ
ncbi:MAG TPA: hypothetical protein VHK69_12885, partial [Chitinophagaceae bacterium]|nr:hypothetical protein [Chitinophagaceae bacterium]